jgi:hypothetical protein
MEKEVAMEKHEEFLPPVPRQGGILDWFMSSRSLQQFFALYKKNGAVSFRASSRFGPQLSERPLNPILRVGSFCAQLWSHGGTGLQHF